MRVKRVVSDMDNTEYIKKLLGHDGSLHLTSMLILVPDNESMASTTLFHILNMDRERIPEDGRKIIDILENDEAFPMRELYIELKWKVLALATIQDAFSGVVYPDSKIKDISAKNYFYFESLHLIREYFYCGFSNYLSAASPIIRTIIEFSIRQIYFDWACSQENSSRPLVKYLTDGITTDPVKMMGRFLPQDNISKPLKKQTQFILKGLSNSSSHAYSPVHSVRGNGRLHHEYSIDSLFFWTTLHLALDSVLWMYYFYYPELFNPKDVPKKFGFSPPMGCFITDQQHVIIKHSLKKDDYNLFKNYAMSTDKIENLNNFYESQTDLTKREIMNTWDKEDGERPKDINSGYYSILTKLRAMNEIMANACALEASKNMQANDELFDLFENAGRYDWWRNNYKNFK